MAGDRGQPPVTEDRHVYVVDVPAMWRRVDTVADGVSAWASADLYEHLIIGAYHLPQAVGPAERRELVDELVGLELEELARVGHGRVVVRRSERDGPQAALTILTGVDAANRVVFAYYFVVSTTVVLKFKLQRIALDRAERDLLLDAAAIAATLRLREIHPDSG